VFRSFLQGNNAVCFDLVRGKEKGWKRYSVESRKRVTLLSGCVQLSGVFSGAGLPKRGSVFCAIWVSKLVRGVDESVDRRGARYTAA
jgi:hypothetical protein